MQRLIIIIAVFAVLVTACSPALQDLTTVEDTEGSSTAVARVIDPDSVTIYRNVDGFANINVLCVNGDAIITRSTNYEDFIVVHIPAGENNLCGGS